MRRHGGDPARRLWAAARRGLVACAAIAIITAAPAQAAPGVITHYPIPILTTPFNVAAGPDGKIWLVDSGNHPGGTFVGRMTTSGAIAASDLVAFPTTDLGMAAVAGPDGNMWVAQNSHIDRIPIGATQTSDITSFPIAGAGGTGSIVAGPDGRMWFARSRTDVGAITTGGDVTSYPTPNPGEDISGIIVGPDGKLWFGESARITRMSTSGVVGPGDDFPLPAGTDNAVQALALGSDGNVWFTVSYGAIGKITPLGTMTFFNIPTADSLPVGITAGPDGQLWFAERNGDNIGSIPTSATSGADIKEYPVGTSNAGLLYLVAGPDKRVWFNEFNNNRLGAMTTNVDATGGGGSTPPVTPPVTPPTPPPVTPPAKAALPVFSKLVTLPSARVCVSRRLFSIRLRVPASSTVVEAQVSVNGKKVAVRRGKRLRSTVDLRKLPKGRFKVEVVLKLADGRKVRDSRRYRTCVPKHRR
jgi:streptogramin lyase